jgi:hypothetical protein
MNARKQEFAALIPFLLCVVIMVIVLNSCRRVDSTDSTPRIEVFCVLTKPASLQPSPGEWNYNSDVLMGIGEVVQILKAEMICEDTGCIDFYEVLFEDQTGWIPTDRCEFISP